MADAAGGRLGELSALVDGELEPDRVAAACRSWRDDAQMRGAWHAWHLIGDVLRSEDLASPPTRDARLVAALGARLAAEPAVLAPAPVAPRRRSWLVASSAVAAGFAVVAGTVLVLHQPESPVMAGDSQQARASAAVPPAVLAAAPTTDVAASATRRVAAAADAEPAPIAATQVLIRDARLDRYLAAHKQFAGSSALGVPSGYLRAATTDAAGR